MAPPLETPAQARPVPLRDDPIAEPELVRDPAVARGYGERDYAARRALALADMAGIALALTLAFELTSVRDLRDDLLLALAALPAWVVLFRVYGLYETPVRRISQSGLDELPAMVHALMVGGLGTWVYFKLVGIHQFVFGEAVIFGIAALVLIALLRRVARWIVARAYGPQRVVFIGASPLTRALVRKMNGHPEYAVEPVGYVARGADRRDLPIPMLARFDDLDFAALVEEHSIERVIVSHGDVDDAAVLTLLEECARLRVKVSLLPRYVDAMGPSLEVDEIEGVTVLGLNPPLLSRSSRLLKRSLDCAVAATGLLISAPLLVAIAVAIKLDSPGPVLFRQRRIGRLGRGFTLLKFRTMTADAEGRAAELFDASEDPHWLKVDHDPRVTRVGRILRSTSLDELPQLWNVLRGDMSLVGPRPLVPREDQQVSGWARVRLDLAPGVTGMWQVLGRTNIPFEEMVRIDYMYVTNWSLWLDLKLLLRTLPVVLSRRGVN